jgi:hypothetical protein
MGTSLFTSARVNKYGKQMHRLRIPLPAFFQYVPTPCIAHWSSTEKKPSILGKGDILDDQ